LDLHHGEHLGGGINFKKMLQEFEDKFLPGEEILVKMQPEEMTWESFALTGFRFPLLVESGHERMGMKIPKPFTVDEVARAVGMSRRSICAKLLEYL
jgi:hypothetical protein